MVKTRMEAALKKLKYPKLTDEQLYDLGKYVMLKTFQR